ncbi:MAG TPA: hypothetical protein VKR23_16015 [Gaiellaceae bacterium]|nr:hypothetical protein [Gaiellaceae bacterium]
MYAQRTDVPVSKSRAEIERLLESRKAKQFGTATDYEKLEARVQFRLHDRVVRFTVALPDPKKLGNGARLDQAERQKWRALLLVIKAKLESVESQIETFEEAFLANIVMPNDQTVAQIVKPQIAESYKSGKMPKQLAAASEDSK